MLTKRDLLRSSARHYPFLPSRGRVPLLNGRLTDIPSGEIVGTREGIRVRVMRDGMYRSVYFWGDYEPYQTKVYRRIVRSGDITFDVGANFGWYSALFAQWVGGTGRVHAFEPVSFIHDLAAETIALNSSAERVQLNPFGLGRENADITLFTYSGLPHGHATATDLARTDAVRHTCEIRRLDDYCQEHGIASIDFMKVDVEGAEIDVFAGGGRVLSCSDAPVIAFEINSTCLKPRSLHGSDIVAALRELGYTEFFSLSTRRGVTRLEPQHLDDADCLAAKQAHLDRIAPALKTGRLLR
jgi:FkbM family methyltransferase